MKCIWLNDAEFSFLRHQPWQCLRCAVNHSFETAGGQAARRNLCIWFTRVTRLKANYTELQCKMLSSAAEEFRRFQDDTNAWLETANAPGSQHAWTDQEKWPVVTDHLRGAAKAWDRYKGMSQQSWSQSSSKVIAAFGHLQHAGCHHPTTYET
ncbi:hypothetical protein HPB50_019699 [Hyalomma asiaticum]|uniref:Uncharacterized protein n=1 Tax=Hyalomma asiaticum TaxID=266040 RepID=A0ACB7S9T6_HYAAI|nr:hypothetical protein HPB50_019699 [Hyalomma asiaticum]